MKIGWVAPVKPSHPYLENDPAPLFDLHYLRCQGRREVGPVGRSKSVPPEVIGQRKCPRQLFRRSVPETGWQQAGRVSE